MDIDSQTPWSSLERRNKPADPELLAEPGFIFIVGALHDSESRNSRFWAIAVGGTNADDLESKLQAAESVLVDESGDKWIPLATFGISIPVVNAKQGKQRLLAFFEDRYIYSGYGDVFTEGWNLKAGDNSLSLVECEEMLQAIADGLLTDLREEQEDTKITGSLPRRHYTTVRFGCANDFIMYLFFLRLSTALEL